MQEQMTLGQTPGTTSAAGSGGPSSLQILSSVFPGSVILRSATSDELAHTRPMPAPLPMRVHDKSLVNAYVAHLLNWFPVGTGLDFTGTYSDDYGLSHGCMLARNVEADFRRFVQQQAPKWTPWAVGIERHPQTHRNVLHLHALIGGEWSAERAAHFVASWEVYRGFAKGRPVVTTEGVASYVVKHLLKQGTEDHLAFRLPPPRFRSRHERREWAAERGLS